MVRFYANENIPGSVVRALRELGFDTRWAAEDAPGESDAGVLSTAMTERRVLVTFDLDFGELAFKAGLPATCEVILLRLPQESPDQLAGVVVPVLSSRTDWAGHFSVIEPGRLRMTDLPGRPA